MKRKIEEKLKAISLRREGYSVNEIVRKVGVAKSSISMWVRGISLTKQARKRLLTKIRLGQVVSAENKRRKTEGIIENHRYHASELLQDTEVGLEMGRIICALIYWCEGTKSYFTGVSFINSDPPLVKTFLYLLRSGFILDESKFRVCLHLHEYHNQEKQLSFWSKLTQIPKKQFVKPFLKANTRTRIRENYPGCISIRYHSTDLSRQLLTLAEAFFSKYGGMV